LAVFLFLAVFSRIGVKHQKSIVCHGLWHNQTLLLISAGLLRQWAGNSKAI